jgi:hypothetical protein
MVTDRSLVSSRVASALALASAVVALAFASTSSAQKPKPPPIDPSETLTFPVPGAASAAASGVKVSTPSPPPLAVPVVAPGATVPRVHHAPISNAAPHENLEILAAIDDPQLVKRALIVYHTADSKVLKEVPLLRGKADLYVATIPADDVFPPSLSYTIEIEQVDGSRITAFSPRETMHEVSVSEDISDTRERALLDQLDGRRAVFSGTVDYSNFGTSALNYSPSMCSNCQQLAGPLRVKDWYVRTEGIFTYRPLGTVLEFSIRLGLVRGQAAVPEGDLDHKAGGLPWDAQELRDGQTKVGLNYGAPTVIFRIVDLFHVEGELLTSVTEQGFAAGGGGAFHIGQPYGSKLVLGFEVIHQFGARFYSRYDIVRGRFRASPLIEVTNMPHADRYGVRLLTELGFNLGAGWAAIVRGGYQARDFSSAAVGGGPSFGLGIAYAF